MQGMLSNICLSVYCLSLNEGYCVCFIKCVFLSLNALKYCPDLPGKLSHSIAMKPCSCIKGRDKELGGGTGKKRNGMEGERRDGTEGEGKETEA